MYKISILIKTSNITKNEYKKNKINIKLCSYLPQILFKINYNEIVLKIDFYKHIFVHHIYITHNLFTRNKNIKFKIYTTNIGIY